MERGELVPKFKVEVPPRQRATLKSGLYQLFAGMGVPPKDGWKRDFLDEYKPSRENIP